MKRIFLISVLALSVCPLWGSGVCAQQIFQDVRINSSPNPVGSGARAMGMGGAFIAVADDATAASWNPGGLMQLERPEFSFVFNFDHRRKALHSSVFSEAGGMHEVHRDDLNYLSVAYPFRAFNKNMIVSLNYQRLYDFYDEVEFDQNIRQVSPTGVFTNIDLHSTFSQAGAVKAVAPAFAIQLTPQFSVGVTFNFWTDNLGFDNEWEIKRTTRAFGAIHAGANTLIKLRSEQMYREKNENFEGFNMNFGFLWDINRVVTLGGVIKTPFTADVDRTTYSVTTSYYVGRGPLRGAPFDRRESIELKFPLSYGLGIAFRLSDTFSIAFDVYRTHWSDFWVKGKQGSTSPITGKPRRESHVKDTTQVRFGCEYLFVLERTIIPLRFGAFYDPEPSEKNPDDFFGITLGTGIMLGNIVLDCAYIYRWGRDVKGDSIEIPGSDADVDQHNFYISMIYHF